MFPRLQCIRYPAHVYASFLPSFRCGRLARVIRRDFPSHPHHHLIISHLTHSKPHLTNTTTHRLSMARNPPFKLSYRHKGSRSSASSHSARSGNTRRTSGSTTTSRRSSTRSASTVHAGPSRPRSGPFVDSTSLGATSEVQRDEDGVDGDDTLNEVSDWYGPSM
jgi:hypothetical protein